MNNAPAQQPITRAIRFAVAAGTLSVVRLQQREAEAERQGVDLLVVLNEPELLHLQLIRKALLPNASWQDAVAEIRRCGANPRALSLPIQNAQPEHETSTPSVRIQRGPH